VRPPTVADNAARLRITLSATHEEENIVQLLNAIADSFRVNP
jgi:8-amino-7-oxononanoate synthase